MKKVILTITLDGPIPAVTKQDIAEQSAEKLKNLDFTYSVQPETEAIDIHNELVSGVISAVNEEPISATLETFGDIQDALDIHNELVSGELAKSQTIGRSSTEQGGSRLNNAYNIDHDPLNEE